MIVSDFCEENRDGGLFSDKFFACLPKTCPDCGMPIEINDTLTGLRCSNERCKGKVGQRIASIMTQLGVKDFGEARIYSFLDKYPMVKNPLLVFSLDYDDAPLGDNINMDISKRIIDQISSHKTFTLAEYVRIANIPNVQMSAFEIFGDVDSLEEAYERIENGGVSFIRDRLSIKDKGDESISVRATKVYQSLMTYKSDLFEALRFVTIQKVNTGETVKVKAVCSNDVGFPFKTKADFYAFCNNRYENVHIDFGTSVTKKTEYVVWNGADGTPARATNKVQKARAYNEKGSDIKIVTAMQFILAMDKQGVLKKENLNTAQSLEVEKFRRQVDD